MISEALDAVVRGLPLSPAQMDGAMEEILAGTATAAQIAALAVALRMRGETAEEIATAAAALRRHAVRVPHRVSGVVLDTCGTGGDGAGTFNVSTVVALVVAASGVAVAKHGNRAVSSRCGSADVLEALGVRIDREPARVAADLEALGIGFAFAPTHHAALRHAAPVRRELGVRTFFNLLGPLANPASATHQLVGVYAADRVTLVARTLGLLGVTRAWVVYGAGGLDELSPSGPTRVAEWRNGAVRELEVTPEDFGLARSSLDGLAGGDARVNAALARAVLAGERGVRRDAVVMNAGAALLIAGAVSTPQEGALRAAEAIDSGRAEALLAAWSATTAA